ncbi:hypothetical protein P4U90_13310, partial [Cytobacillus kochii]|uniref:hypothetical protein n=1 Tax=Cytobacillus kochii TaxID=859143 RepID=UPI002E2354A0|nr:hypothetical protein [Cytobacillus kochii]
MSNLVVYRRKRVKNTKPKKKMVGFMHKHVKNPHDQRKSRRIRAESYWTKRVNLLVFCVPGM